MFRRLSNIFRGFVGLFISGLEKRNPEALLELEKENLRKQIAQFNPHETLSPALSAEAIKRHVENGLKIGRAWSLPQEILDILVPAHATGTPLQQAAIDWALASRLIDERLAPLG